MRNQKTFLYHLLILSLTFVELTVIIPAHANTRPSPLYFSNLRQEDGLPSNMINTITQDSLGFIWIGTNNGLCRYDGYTTITFKEEGKPNTLPNSNVRSLLLDGDDIWVGTWEGLCTINTKTLQITPFNLGANASIRSLYKSKDNRIWIGTSNGLIVYDKTINQYDYYDAQNSALSHSTIRCLYEAADSTMWIGTYDKLNRFKNGVIHSFDLKGGYKPYLQNNLILDIERAAPDNDSILLIGTETGLVTFNRYTFSHQTYNSSNTNISNEVIKCIHREGHELWLGTDFGLSVMNTDFKTINAFFHNPILNHTIANNVIWKIFKDRNNTLWLLTSNGVSIVNTDDALFRLHEEFYTIDNQKAGNQIRDILVSDDGTLYLATIHGIIEKSINSTAEHHFNANLNGPRKLLLDNAFALSLDSAGQVWMGTAGGINIWDPLGKTMKAISSNKTNGLTSNYISSITCTADGSMWINAWEGGIFKVNGRPDNIESLHFINVDKTAPDNIYACGERIYYHTSDQLFSIDNKSLEKKEVTRVNKTLDGQSILCINVSHDNNIWLATEHNLICYNPQNENLDTHPLSNPLINQPIGLEVGSDHNIWMAALNAIIKYDLSTGKAISMPLHPNSPLKSFYSSCSALSPAGHIYFGGDNGYVESIIRNNAPQIQIPEAVISAMSINNKPVSTIHPNKIITQDIAYVDELILNHNNNSLTFFFSTLNYWQADKSLYRYRLNHFDGDWNSTLNTNFATYSNLRPGKYTLEVESYNYAGIKSSVPHHLRITIRPPLWLSQPFILLYLVLAAAMIYLTIRVFAFRQKLKTELHISQMGKKHAEELFNTKQKFFTHISHELRTPLSLITPPIKQVIQSGTLKGKNLEMLKLAEKNSKRLLNLVNQILDFRKLENQSLPLIPSNLDIVGLTKEIHNSFSDMASRNEINYEFHCEVPHLVVLADREKTEAILFNILANAFKHTPQNGCITTRVRPPEGGQGLLEISITDTGIGIARKEQELIFENFYQSENASSPRYGTGIGLSMARQYAQLHRGRISVISSPGKGSTFTFAFPVEKNELLASFPPPLPAMKQEGAIFKNPNKHLKKILIVDDNADILDYIEMNLNLDYRIQRAGNGKKGLEKSSLFRPDLIVSDIMMPVMDGLEMCKALKADASSRHIPVILLTAKSLDIQKTEGIESGANMYITKPFDINYLKACIHNLIQSEVQLQQYISHKLMVSPKEPSQTLNNQDERFILKVMEIIAREVGNANLSVETISSEMGLSSTHLYRKLKAITNQSTKDIIKNYRLNLAAQMIRNNEGNLTEITDHVGFGSLSGFSKTFKTVFGCSPSQYKETNRPEGPYRQQ